MGLCAHETIALDVEATICTNRPEDNCTGYNFNGLYLLWSAPSLLSRSHNRAAPGKQSPMSRTSQPVRAGPYFDVLAAVFVSLLSRRQCHCWRRAFPYWRPRSLSSEHRMAIVAFYPIGVYVTAVLISFHIPKLLFRMGGMGLSIASILIGSAGLLLLLPPYAAAADRHRSPSAAAPPR